MLTGLICARPTRLWEEDHDHRGKRRGVFATAELQATWQESDFGVTEDPLVEPACIRPGRKQHHNQSPALAFFERLVDPGTRFVPAIRRVNEGCKGRPRLGQAVVCLREERTALRILCGCGRIKPEVEFLVEPVVKVLRGSPFPRSTGEHKFLVHNTVCLI